jgi:hypothetical protein
MLLVLVAVVVGGLVGVALPARPRHVVRPALGTVWPLGVAVVAQLLLLVVPDALEVLVAAIGLVALIATATANRHIAGIAVVGVGALLNLGALAFNGGVPVDREAAVAGHVATVDELDHLDPGPARHLARPGDAAPLLGDIVPIAPLHAAVSFGDLVVAVGLTDTVVLLARRRRRVRRAAAPGVRWQGFAAQVDHVVDLVDLVDGTDVGDVVDDTDTPPVARPRMQGREAVLVASRR